MRTRFWNYLFNSRVNLSHSNTFNVFSVDSATHPRPRVVCQSIYVIWFNFQYVIFDVLLFTHSIINWSLNHYLANLTKKDVLFCFLVFFFWFNWYELFFKFVAGSRTFVEFLKSFVSERFRSRRAANYEQPIQSLLHLTACKLSASLLADVRAELEVYHELVSGSIYLS